MKKLSLCVLAICCQIHITAQVYETSDGLTVTLKKVKNVRDKGDLNSYVKITDPSVDKILVKCYIESEDGTSVDINSFALVDQEHKLRYRAVDLYNYHKFSPIFNSGKAARLMLKTPFENETPYEYNVTATYDPDVRDTFLDYDLNGYENVERKMNFGSRRNPSCNYIYYSPTELNEFTAEFFYAVSRESASPSFDLYYKGEKLFEIDMPKRKSS